MNEDQPTNADHHPSAADGPPAVRVVSSAELLLGSREVFIRHAGELYRLIVTKNDKLILQK